MSQTSRKYGALVAFIIAGALIVSYGFNRIETQQHNQNKIAKQLHSLIVQNEKLAKGVATNTTDSLKRQRSSDLVLCNAINRFRPPPPKLNCDQIESEAQTSATAEGH